MLTSVRVLHVVLGVLLDLVDHLDPVVLVPLCFQLFQVFLPDQMAQLHLFVPVDPVDLVLHVVPVILADHQILI